MRPLVYTITAHGFGHGVRSCDVLNALHRARPDLPIHVVSGLPEGFLRNRVKGPFTLHNRQFDSGMAQIDSVRVDLDASLRAVQSVLANRVTSRAAERAWLRSIRAGLVVCDIPAIPMEAARAEGIPALAIGNFSWAWIYQEFADQPGWSEVIEAFSEGYRCADALLRLPFSEPFDLFPTQIPVPLLARPGRPDRARLARLTGADPGKTWVLLSFSTLEWDEAAVAEARRIRDFEFFTLMPLRWDGENLHAVDRDAFTVPELFATVDAVLTKPGYGVLSECIANAKPLVYVDRQNFRETPILVDAIRRHLPHAEIPTADLYAGRLEPSLRAALASTPAEPPPPLGGDDVCAAHMLRRLGE